MGILEQILAQVDNAKRVAGKNTKDFIENPSDFLAMVTGRVKEKSDKLASRDPEVLNELIGNAIPGGGAVGMIRKGGRTDLNMTHQSKLDSLINLLTGRGSVHSPSVAISSGNAFPFTDISNIRSGSLVINPASHRFDPELNPANLLLNRDAYVTRQKWTPKEVRLQLGDDLRLTEGGKGRTIDELYASVPQNNLPGTQQQLSILASPRFRSFREYEKSDKGAALLSDETSYGYPKITGLLESVFGDEYRKAVQGGKVIDTQELLSKITGREKALLALDPKKSTDAENMELIAAYAIQRAFSDYAELKVAGEVPLNNKTVSAVMLSPYTSYTTSVPARVEDSIKELTKKAEAKGIRVGTPEELMPSDMQMTYMDMAEQMARMMMKEREKTGSAYAALDALPSSSLKYIPGGIMPTDLEDALFSKSLTATYENTLDAIKRSNAYAGDVASMLTARDLDAVSTPNILKLLQENFK